MGVQWGPTPLFKSKAKENRIEKVNATPPWYQFEHLNFHYFEESRTKTRIIWELENFVQTSENRTRRIRVKAHRPFIYKRSLTLKMELIPHFYQFQLQLHLNSALNIVNFEVKKLTHTKNDGKLTIKHKISNRIRSYFTDIDLKISQTACQSHRFRRTSNTANR